MKSFVKMAVVAFGVSVFSATSCVKGIETQSVDVSEMVTLAFDVPVAKTKVSGAVEEDRVENVQVFVFDMQDQIQNSGYSGGSSLSLTCTTGEKKFAALVNAPECSGIKTLQDLEALTSDFSDNGLGHFIMSGQSVQEIHASQSVSIPVNRLVSKVVLSEVCNNFKLQQHKEMDFVVESVFVVNAAGSVGYLADSDCATWINSGLSDMSQIISASGELLYDDLPDTPVTWGQTAEFANALYCYPNMSEEVVSYLVVEAVLGNSRCYYPVPLPQMQSNVCYSVSLTVTMPGSPSPDIPVQKGDATFSVVVADWSGNILVNETL